MPEPVCKSQRGGGYKLRLQCWPLIEYFVRNTVVREVKCEVRVRSHNASHNFPRENDPKIRPGNPPYKEPVARKKQGQRFTKNDH